MVAPGRDYMVSPFFRPQIDEHHKKSLRLKISGFLVQMRLKTEHEKTRSLPQISGVIVSHHNMVSLQNGVTRGGPPFPPSDATGTNQFDYVSRIDPSWKQE